MAVAVRSAFLSTPSRKDRQVAKRQTNRLRAALRLCDLGAFAFGRSSRIGNVALIVMSMIGGSAMAQDGRPAVKQGKTLPPIKEPVLFNTPEADVIVAAMQIFPADNPWNADVSQWKLHPDSDAIVASIGKDWKRVFGE